MFRTSKHLIHSTAFLVCALALASSISHASSRRHVTPKASKTDGQESSPAVAPVYSQEQLDAILPPEKSDADQTPARKMTDEERALQHELLRSAPHLTKTSIKDIPPLTWTSPTHPERNVWTRYLVSTVDSVFDDLDQAEDMTTFCPKYDDLSHDQKVIAWAELFTAISFWESTYDPTAHAIEKYADGGIDDVTGLPVYSEGLLQLSYQDVDQDEAGPYCKFDWQHDKKLAADDVHRTIFNPYTNLFCGVHLMAATVKANDNKIVVKENYYWSTLQEGNLGENRVSQISALVERLPFCGKTFHNPIIGAILTLYRKVHSAHRDK